MPDLRERLAKRKVTQVELARACGVDPAVVGQWASGRRKVPAAHVPTVNRLAAPSTWCGSHRRDKPCVQCARNSERQKELWKSPERLAQHLALMEKREGHLHQEEVDIIRANAGTSDGSQITALVNSWRRENKLRPRTQDAVLACALRNGVLISWRELPTVMDVCHIFHVKRSTVHRWRRDGYVTGKPWGRGWVFTHEELEELVRKHTWLIDYQRMEKGRLRDLAEQVSRRDPWLPATVAAREVPCNRPTLMQFVQAGTIEAKRRPGRFGAVMIRASSLVEVRERLLGRSHQAAAALLIQRRQRQRDRAA